jgi:hypothetical protein
MAQNLADLFQLFQRGAPAEYARGGGVPQAVREHGSRAGALRCAGRALRDRLAGQRPVRGRDPGERFPALRGGRRTSRR